MTLVAVVLTLLASSLSTAFAQDGTPVARDAGGAVTIYGSDGQPAGEIAVDALVDPFEDYDPSSAPQRGFHYVMATITVTADDAPIDASPYYISVVDTDGFVYSYAYMYRDSEQTEALPDFPGGTIEPGDSMSGAIFFQVLDGVELGYVIFQPTYDTIITAADLRDAPVEQGDTVEYLASDGRPAATITIDGVIAPLEDYDPSYAPQRGFEYIGVQVTIENVGTGDFEIDTYDFVAVDAEGFIYNAYSIYRPEEAEAALPSLPYGEMLPAGESITGLVTFEVLAGTNPGMIYFSTASDRQIRLAEYGDGQAPTPSDTPIGIPTRTTEEPKDDVPSASSEECEAVVAWGEDSLANIEAWSNSFDAIGGVFTGEDLDADAIRDAADALLDAADAQSELDVPEIAEDANDALIDAFEQSAGALNDLADAVEANDEAAIAAAAGQITTIFSSVELEETFEALVTACPELDEVGA